VSAARRERGDKGEGEHALYTCIVVQLVTCTRRYTRGRVNQ
jgi:hypothetical protein